jgi:hypothetical protein
MKSKSDLVKKTLIETFRILGRSNMSDYLDELNNDRIFLDSINSMIKTKDIFIKRNFKDIYELSDYSNFLYCLIRSLKPRVVVETGVLHGLTSAWILKALDDNKLGRLISIDLPRRDWDKHFKGIEFGDGGDTEFEIKEEPPGWVVPENLTSNWELILGPSSKYLQGICKTEDNIDLFIHDSDHSYDTMKLECELIQKYHPSSTIVIDDYYANNFAFDFQKTTGRTLFEIDDVTDELKETKGCALLDK